jgi:predicted oxidoreductase
MVRGDSLRRSEDVDGSSAAQRHRTGDLAFTGSGRHLRTGGISMGSLRPRHVLPRAQAGPSRLRVKQALIRVVAADVEGRANVLLH